MSLIAVRGSANSAANPRSAAPISVASSASPESRSLARSRLTELYPV